MINQLIQKHDMIRILVSYNHTSRLYITIYWLYVRMSWPEHSELARVSDHSNLRNTTAELINTGGIKAVFEKVWRKIWLVLTKNILPCSTFGSNILRIRNTNVIKEKVYSKVDNNTHFNLHHHINDTNHDNLGWLVSIFCFLFLYVLIFSSFQTFLGISYHSHTQVTSLRSIKTKYIKYIF